MRNLVLLLIGCTLSCFAEAGDHIRYVFKSKPQKFLASLNQPIKQMDFGLSPSQAEQILQLTDGEVDFTNTYYMDVPSSQKHLFKDSATDVIYPNVLPPFTFQAVTIKAGDPSLMNQWWLTALKVPSAWKHATGRGVTIADCDAGYYHNEPDLFANMLLQYRYDLSNQQGPYVVDDGGMTSHGTSVAAIMVGVLNGSGTSGIAYNAKLVPLQNYNYDKKLDGLNKEEATARCIMRAISTPNVQIIVLENQTETGSSETFSGTRSAVRLALKSGIIVVGAAGNYGVELTTEENDDTGSIIVGALTSSGATASYSNYGDRVTTAAFGEGLYTLAGTGGYMGMFGGTSGATPQVAAAVALMKEVNPRLNPAQARRILEKTRVSNSSNHDVGGQLDVEAVVTAARYSIVSETEYQQQQQFRQKLVNILNY